MTLRERCASSSGLTSLDVPVDEGAKLRTLVSHFSPTLRQGAQDGIRLVRAILFPPRRPRRPTEAGGSLEGVRPPGPRQSGGNAAANRRNEAEGSRSPGHAAGGS